MKGKLFRASYSDINHCSQLYFLLNRKIIAPTISLQTGKIVYDWHIGLKNNSSIRTHVDPSNGIRVVWIDGVHGKVTGGNCWVTEVRAPLGFTAPGSRIGDIRIGRRWVM